MKLPIALLQFTGRNTIQANIALCRQLISQAAAEGAKFLFLPEVSNIVERHPQQIKNQTYLEEKDPFLQMCKTLAKEHGLWIHIGSLALQQKNESRLANRGFLLNPNGALVGFYDKIHMFDVDLPNGEQYRESHNFKPGSKACLLTTDWGKLGLSICYDLRFPHLYRHLAQSGAKFIACPAAFTQKTGEAHWHALLKARAIENSCFIIAAAQTGHHADGRKTFGHSLVVSPWGDIQLDSGKEEGVFHSILDLTEVDQARQNIPSLTADHAFTPVESA